MDISQIVVSSIPNFAQYILAPATFTIVSFLIFIYWRSGSSHALLLKTWLAVFGQTTIKSKAIQQFTSDELDLTHFRYLTGIKVSTLKEAERLFLWSSERNIGLRLIRKAGSHIDIEKPGPALSIFLLGRRHLYWRLVPLGALVIFFSVLVGLTQYQRALITIRPNEKNFTVDREYAASITGRDKFYFKNCSKIAKSEAIDEVSLKALCDMNNDPQIGEKLSKIIKDQHLICWILSGYAMAPLILVVSSLARVNAAIQVRKKLEAYQKSLTSPDRPALEEIINPEISLSQSIKQQSARAALNRGDS